MADLGISGPLSPSPAPATVTPQPANVVNLTPANAPQSANSAAFGPGRVVNLQPANVVNLTPANAPQSASAASFGPGAAPGRVVNLQPANVVNLTPANAPQSPTPAAYGPGAAPGRVMNLQPANVVNLTPANAPQGGGNTAAFGPGASAGRVVNLTPANAPQSPNPAAFGPGAAPGRVINLTPANAQPAPSSFGPGGGASFGPGGGASFGPGGGASFGPGGGASFGPGSGASFGPGGGASFGPGAAKTAYSATSQNDQPIKLATHTPDGREIIHKGPPCANCGEMIIGQCINALGKTYHPEHFVCFCCSQPFKDGKFMIKDNEPYCETDYFELFGNRCRTCGETIKTKYIQAEEFYFHPEHFVCMRCGKSLAGQKYKVQKDGDRDVLCIDCHVKNIEKAEAEAKICAKCKQPIIGEFIILRGQHMHPEHFRCAECGCAFTGGNCHEYEGELYCLTHYELMLKKICARCQKPILGRGVNAVGRMWHPEHFGCHVCGEILNGASFFEKDGEPYCETHYVQLFGVMCAKCGKPVLAGGKMFLDKHYHENCLCCYVCDKLLKPGKIREWEFKPYCTNCYEKLPSEVRKKYEKKRDLEIRQEKQRQREAIKAERERIKKMAEKDKKK